MKNHPLKASWLEVYELVNRISRKLQELHSRAGQDCDLRRLSLGSILLLAVIISMNPFWGAAAVLGMAIYLSR